MVAHELARDPTAAVHRLVSVLQLCLLHKVLTNKEHTLSVSVCSTGIFPVRLQRFFGVFAIQGENENS